MENREKSILKNSLIFTIGNLGSKVLSYVMLIFYTFFISSAELGYYDIVLTTISLLMPIVMISFDEGIYRWLIDAKSEDKKTILATCIKTVLFPCSFAAIVFAFFNFWFYFQYAIEILFLFLSTLMYHLILNAIRGLSNNKLYAASGILNSSLLLLFELVGLVIFKLGIESLIISNIAANVLTLLYIYIRQPEFHHFLHLSADKKLAVDIIKYTVPLIPNSVSWWVVNSSDRYIILFFLGQACNGIYTISNKFPTVITTVSSILYFALQESIIKEYNSSDRDCFYSKIFEKYYIFLFSLVLCGVPLTKLTIKYLTGSEYTIAWQYTGFLFLSTVFSALSSFLGIGYQISRDTKKSAYTTILAAIVNICINFAVIRWIGLHAAAVSTLLSYMVLFIVRIIHSRKYFKLTIDWKKFIGIFLICFFSIGVTYVGENTIVIAAFAVGLLLAVFLNKEFIRIALHKVGRTG